MATQTGYFADILVPSKDPHYKYEVERIWFKRDEESLYLSFIETNKSMLRSHGKRYS